MNFGSDDGFNFFEAMDRIGGFPVRGKIFEDGELDEEFSLESVTERDIDPDAFIPPPGYRLRTMGGFFGNAGVTEAEALGSIKDHTTIPMLTEILSECLVPYCGISRQ